MPKSKHQKQQKRMKNRRKEKARKQNASSGGIAISGRGLIKRANKFPIHSCLINANWGDEDGLTRIVITREQPDGLLVFGSFMVDMLLLGVKDANSVPNITPSTLNDMLGYVYPDTVSEPCDVGLAHQIVYQSIDYAARYEMKPHKDFRLARHLLDPRGTYPESHDLTFGKDGKPFFISGPYDNADAIIKKLERTAGAGNYDYVMNAGPGLTGLSGLFSD